MRVYSTMGKIMGFLEVLNGEVMLEYILVKEKKKPVS